MIERLKHVVVLMWWGTKNFLWMQKYKIIVHIERFLHWAKGMGN